MQNITFDEVTKQHIISETYAHMACDHCDEENIETCEIRIENVATGEVTYNESVLAGAPTMKRRRKRRNPSPGPLEYRPGGGPLSRAPSHAQSPPHRSTFESQQVLTDLESQQVLTDSQPVVLEDDDRPPAARNLEDHRQFMIATSVEAMEMISRSIRGYQLALIEIIRSS